ncbi:MAG TPA: hypothetical protein VHN18_02670 [Micromonosporaceae bacterium]|nr:hypothetical protein [Micromonosporaceae bacterium]
MSTSIAALIARMEADLGSLVAAGDLLARRGFGVVLSAPAP